MAEQKTLVIPLVERIDALNADQVLQDLSSTITAGQYDEVILDADQLTYISSAGLRTLLSVKKKLMPNLKLVNASREVYDIFEVTGFSQLLDIQKKMRKVSVEGCEVIGRGYCGTVYRIDPETIIKVYHDSSATTLADIENEKNMAKIALVHGIPTAISYDIVKVGDCYGSIFELLNAVTFNDLVIKEPERVDEITRQYVDFLKVIHDTEIDDPLLTSAKKKFLEYLDFLVPYVDATLLSRLREFLEAMEDSHYVVHGDPQMKNIMLVAGEPMLIDMDTLCAGDPLFDLQAIYVTYVAYGEDDPGNSMSFLGIPSDTANHIWEKILEYTLEGLTEKEKETTIAKIQTLAYIRFLYLITSSTPVTSELSQLRIRHATEKLRTLMKV